MGIAEKIRSARESSDHRSARAAAIAAKIPQQTWSAYESGTAEPTASRVAAICRALGVTSDWLLGLSRKKRA